VEARKRIDQMIWLLSEIEKLLRAGEDAQVLQNEIGGLLVRNEITPDYEEWDQRLREPTVSLALKAMVQISQPLEILTESFYWIAGRARHVLRALPELKKFEAEGIRNIRNKLLEHADSSDSGVMITSLPGAVITDPL
jgi:hypothetical protein